jgi:cyclopropane fatty-acyl-phospholipid synthase-like methyltransferase
MLRYHLAALALKSLSTTSLTRRFYRDVLGNHFGEQRRMRVGLESYPLEKARRFLELCQEFGTVRDGMRLLELGTGWMHFYAVFIRLFYDVRVTLVDVWDNRQFAAFRRAFRKLDEVLDDALAVTPAQSRRAHALLGEISGVASFEELYRVLDFEYHLDTSGLHDALPTEGFDLAFSFDVLEHVERGGVPALARNLTRVVKPGGAQMHLVGIGDHLTNYDHSMSWKNYLRYSDRTWKLFFENRLQYINRLQASELLEIFADCGTTLLHEERTTCPIDGLRVNHDFARFDRPDLECTVLFMVLRKG